uniref:Ataxin 10 n=1 Tax=Coturnix japonica TaxID=93934 RepID=A0A8C2YE69_COTJA
MFVLHVASIYLPGCAESHRMVLRAPVGRRIKADREDIPTDNLLRVFLRKRQCFTEHSPECPLCPVGQPSRHPATGRKRKKQRSKGKKHSPFSSSTGPGQLQGAAERTAHPPSPSARCWGRAAAISARRGRSWAVPGYAMAAKAGALPEVAARLKRLMAAEPSARLESVRAMTGLFREAQPREMAEESLFRDLLEILMRASNEIEQACKDSSELLGLDTCLMLIAECFRCLRNACVQCAKNQHIMRNLGLIATSVHLIKLLDGMQVKEEPLLIAFRCSLQFLGNIAAGNGDSQNSIWKCAFPDLFLTCLTYSDEKIVAYCCMVLFTCLNSEKVKELLDPGNLSVALHVIKVYKERLESEWSFLIVTDYLLQCPELVKALYAKLSNQERVTFLELMMAKVSEKNSVTSEEMNVFMRHAEFLSGCFKEKCEAVLKLTSAADAEDEEALVTIRLLDILCEMTSNNGQLEYLQTLPDLLQTAIDTLRLTHLAGKQTVNIFTATHSMKWQEEISHPAVGFKAHLIRLIGNLCYKNKENQDKWLDTSDAARFGSVLMKCKYDFLPGKVLQSCQKKGLNGSYQFTFPEQDWLEYSWLIFGSSFVETCNIEDCFSILFTSWMASH